MELFVQCKTAEERSLHLLEIAHDFLMIADHRLASAQVKDPDLKEWGTKTLPVLQVHLNLAKRIEAKLT